MIYYTSRVYSSNQFDVFQDLQVWNELVANMKKIDDSVWKVWTIADVFRINPTIGTQDYNLQQTWEPTEVIVSQNAASYLRIEQRPGQCSFTLASPSQSALQNLQALIANLYEPVTCAGLDDFLQRNMETPIRFVELFDRETGNKVRNSFTFPVNLASILFQFPPTRWDVLDVSVIPSITDPLPVMRLQIKAEAKQAWFLLDEEQILSHPEPVQTRNLFTLIDIAFGTLSMPAYV